MLMDALTTLSNADGTTLEGAAAGATVYSNVLDLSTSRDIGTANVPISAEFSVVPTSATGGATLLVALQTSADNATWVTLQDGGNTPIANVSLADPFVFRGTVPTGVLRYLRFAYTPSAVLTAGTITTQLGADWHRVKSYPRNYVA